MTLPHYPPVISKHFTYAETIKTSTHWDNTPTPQQLIAIQETALKMELVRSLLQSRITVNSWFRSPKVNAAVGGSPASEHTLGRAVDFVCPGYGTPRQITELLSLYSERLNYNQLIFEQTWVHISFPIPGRVGKKQNLEYKNGKYFPFV